MRKFSTYYTFKKDFRLEFQSEAFVSDKPRLLLTAAVAVWKPKVEAGYEPGKIAQYVLSN